MDNQTIVVLIASAAVVSVVLLLVFGRNLFKNIAVHFPGGSAITAQGADRPLGAVTVENSTAKAGNIDARSKVGGNVSVKGSTAGDSITASASDERANKNPNH